MQYGSHVGYEPGANGPVRLPAKFYWKEKKISENPPQYTKVAYVKVFLPGGDTVDCKAEDKHKLEYARQWAAFEAGSDQATAGWPLEHCSFLDVAQVATYKALGIHTVEGLTEAPQTVLQKIMGAVEHQKQAVAILRAAKDAEPILKLTAEKDALAAEVNLLKAQVAELCAEMDKNKKKDKHSDK